MSKPACEIHPIIEEACSEAGLDLTLIKVHGSGADEGKMVPYFMHSEVGLTPSANHCTALGAAGHDYAVAQVCALQSAAQAEAASVAAAATRARIDKMDTVQLRQELLALIEGRPSRPPPAAAGSSSDPLPPSSGYLTCAARVCAEGGFAAAAHL